MIVVNVDSNLGHFQFASLSGADYGCIGGREESFC